MDPTVPEGTGGTTKVARGTLATHARGQPHQRRLWGMAAGEASSGTGRAWCAHAWAEGRGAREGGKVTVGATQ